MFACCFSVFVDTLDAPDLIASLSPCAAVFVQYLSGDGCQQKQRSAFALFTRQLQATHRPANPPMPFLRKL